jgi:hypothetical protein
MIRCKILQLLARPRPKGKQARLVRPFDFAGTVDNVSKLRLAVFPLDHDRDIIINDRVF